MRTVSRISDAELETIDEYQLESRLRVIPRVLETVYTPLINLLGELLQAAFSRT